ncbi:SWIM zinc finger family protein [Myxococcota bacterium]|nr:SWIM zinc finger family protein [Myxococcota bacterium]
MGVAFTRESVLALAPDPSAAKAGQELATPRKWVRLGHDDVALWGECQGSGKTPYLVVVDLSEPAFKCTCPSRKFPCKHGLGLLLLHASSGPPLPRVERPPWAAEWMGARAARAEKRAAKADAPAKPVDEEARAERRAKRLDRVARGLDDLSLWLEDLVEAGLSSAPAKGYGFFEEQARRLIDAQAPGVARMVGGLGELAAGGEGWQTRFVDALGRLVLLVRAFERRESLPEPLRTTMLATVGMPVDQDALLAGAGTRATWQVVSEETREEEQLRVRRTWLVSAAVERPRLLVDFAFAGAPLERGLPLGAELSAELVAHPSSPRVLVRARDERTTKMVALAAWPSIDVALERWARQLADNPWTERLAFPLAAVTPVIDGPRGWLVDAHGTALPLSVRAEASWRLLALSGGHPLELVVEWDGRAARALTAFTDGTIVTIGPSAEAA